MGVAGVSFAPVFVAGLDMSEVKVSFRILGSVDIRFNISFSFSL